ncbi:hypothetical protein ACGFX4_19460 [Kitasatospora sp. NPDC048365]|uniref:hypothetical protein n=1 Tax=Kitasatospora sp. NPDC048365 TaxID=3364050 RepID=UPI003722FDB1
MRVTEHLGWDRGLPLRYLLVTEVEDEDDYESVDLLAKCADAEGLYLPPVSPDRTTLTLRGCPLDSELAALATRPAAADRLLGDLVAVAVDPADREPPEDLDLVDVSVVTHRPTPGHPDRIDLVVGAGLRFDTRYGRKPHPPSSPVVEIWSADPTRTEPLGTCLTVGGLTGLRRSRPDPIDLIGCEPTERLLHTMRNPRPWQNAWAKLVALDRDGRILTHHEVVLDITSARPSVLGGTLLDLTLADGTSDRPVPETRAVHERWYDGPPTEPNLWAALPTPARSEWLWISTVGPYGNDIGRSGGEYHLDGRFATDRPGLLLAIAEAVLGPGREIGRNLFWLRDRLGGGPEVVPPFSLVWHDSEVALRAFATDFLGPGRTYLDEVLEILRERGVAVVLD